MAVILGNDAPNSSLPIHWLNEVLCLLLVQYDVLLG